MVGVLQRHNTWRRFGGPNGFEASSMQVRRYGVSSREPTLDNNLRAESSE